MEATTERRVRMSGRERREQLLEIARTLFAEKGYDASSIEEIAQRADVSKPIVYEHFGGKEGLYAVIVDREISSLLARITGSLEADHPRVMLEQAAGSFLAYIEEEPEGFGIMVRDRPAVSTSGSFGSLLGDIAAQVEYVLVAQFKSRGYDPKLAPLYSRALVGMVALVGQWWLEAKKPKREVVVAHLANLAWNGLSHLDPEPERRTKD